MSAPDRPRILIVGLGNVGDRFTHTHHNIGFLALDAFAASHNLAWSGDRKHKASIATYQAPGADVILAKPTTMMNDSGAAVGPLSAFYRVDPAHLWIVYDELDLRLGDLKISLGTSSNGHNGTRSIEQRLGHNRFTRFRLGVDTRQGREIPGLEYVLQPIGDDVRADLDRGLTRAVAALQLALASGVDMAMGAYNGSRANPVP